MTRWLNDGKAVIQMSIRGKRSDIFWFTFFHEACHVLRHRKQRLIILDGIDSDGENAGIEDEANQICRRLSCRSRAVGNVYIYRRLQLRNR